MVSDDIILYMKTIKNSIVAVVVVFGFVVTFGSFAQATNPPNAPGRAPSPSRSRSVSPAPQNSHNQPRVKMDSTIRAAAALQHAQKAGAHGDIANAFHHGKNDGKNGQSAHGSGSGSGSHHPNILEQARQNLDQVRAVQIPNVPHQ
jgi:hypothetical protein